MEADIKRWDDDCWGLDGQYVSYMQKPSHRQKFHDGSSNGGNNYASILHLLELQYLRMRPMFSYFPDKSSIWENPPASGCRQYLCCWSISPCKSTQLTPAWPHNFTSLYALGFITTINLKNLHVCPHDNKVILIQAVGIRSLMPPPSPWGLGMTDCHWKH